MHPNQRAATQQRVLKEAGRIDTGGFFNLLTGPQLLDQVAALVPAHRERAFPPTETLAMFKTKQTKGHVRQRVKTKGHKTKGQVFPFAKHKTKGQVFPFAKHEAKGKT